MIAPVLAPPVVTLEPYHLELFAYHCAVLYRERGRVGLSRPDGAFVDVYIAPNALSAAEGDIWDCVSMNGHAVGNRHGAATAYARFWAGVPEWWRA